LLINNLGMAHLVGRVVVDCNWRLVDKILVCSAVPNFGTWSMSSIASNGSSSPLKKGVEGGLWIQDALDGRVYTLPIMK
jgi:hypothetical protein